MSADVDPTPNSANDSLIPTQLEKLAGESTQDHWIREVPSTFSGMTGWAAGVGVLALVIIGTMALLGSRGSAPAAPAPSAASDGVVHVRTADLGPCGVSFAGATSHGQLYQVALEVSEVGRVTRVAASGPISSEAKSCLQAHVATWDFLPQKGPVSLTVDMSVTP